jgi:hypothetical protein
MKKDLITFRSITPAQQAQRLLRRWGVEASLQRTPGYLQERGCSYCLGLHPKDTLRAIRVLEEGKVPFSKLYPGGEEET